jgi:hypothetical protein
LGGIFDSVSDSKSRTKLLKRQKKIAVANKNEFHRAIVPNKFAFFNFPNNFAFFNLAVAKAEKFFNLAVAQAEKFQDDAISR